MIVVDPIIAGAIDVARDHYLAELPLPAAAEQRALLALMLTPTAILTPAGIGFESPLGYAYAGIAEHADILACGAPSVADELALRRAAAEMRQAARMLAHRATTARMPPIPDAEAAARLRAGDLSGVGPIPEVVLEPIDDEESVPVELLEVGGDR